MSLPSRERGLKSGDIISARDADLVAPFTGAWIEIPSTSRNMTAQSVAPFTGAWIEIRFGEWVNGSRQSLPSRERGLKFR